MTTPRLLATLAVAAALVLAPGAAHAADGAFEYSTDGVSWSASPPASVFPSTWVAVPGSSISANLHLRAARPGNTVVGVYVGHATASDREVLAATRITGAGTAGTALAAVGDCTELAPQAVLAQGQAITVPLRLALSSDLTGGQSATLGLDLLIDLSDTGVPTLPGGCPVDPEIVAAFPAPSAPAAPAALSTSGAEFPSSALAAGIALVAGGLAALLAPRRRRS